MLALRWLLSRISSFRRESNTPLRIDHELAGRPERDLPLLGKVASGCEVSFFFWKIGAPTFRMTPALRGLHSEPSDVDMSVRGGLRLIDPADRYSFLLDLRRRIDCEDQYIDGHYRLRCPQSRDFQNVVMRSVRNGAMLGGMVAAIPNASLTYVWRPHLSDKQDPVDAMISRLSPARQYVLMQEINIARAKKILLPENACAMRFHRNARGTGHLQGYIVTTYARLRKAFGDPNRCLEVAANWDMVFEDGTDAGIYVYKTHPIPKSLHAWHVRGKSNAAVARIAEVLKTNFYVRRLAEEEWEPPF